MTKAPGNNFVRFVTDIDETEEEKNKERSEAGEEEKEAGEEVQEEKERKEVEEEAAKEVQEEKEAEEEEKEEGEKDKHDMFLTTHSTAVSLMSSHDVSVDNNDNTENNFKEAGREVEQEKGAEEEKEEEDMFLTIHSTAVGSGSSDYVVSVDNNDNTENNFKEVGREVEEGKGAEEEQKEGKKEQEDMFLTSHSTAVSSGSSDDVVSVDNNDNTENNFKEAGREVQEGKGAEEGKEEGKREQEDMILTTHSTTVSSGSSDDVVSVDNNDNTENNFEEAGREVEEEKGAEGGKGAEEEQKEEGRKEQEDMFLTTHSTAVRLVSSDDVVSVDNNDNTENNFIEAGREVEDKKEEPEEKEEGKKEQEDMFLTTHSTAVSLVSSDDVVSVNNNDNTENNFKEAGREVEEKEKPKEKEESEEKEQAEEGHEVMFLTIRSTAVSSGSSDDVVSVDNNDDAENNFEGTTEGQTSSSLSSSTLFGADTVDAADCAAGGGGGGAGSSATDCDTAVNDCLTPAKMAVQAVGCGSASAISRMIFSDNEEDEHEESKGTAAAPQRRSGNNPRPTKNNDVDNESTIQKIAKSVSFSSIVSSKSNTDYNYNNKDDDEQDASLDQPVLQSDLSNPTRRIWVVTTATLPWRTGTAVNPLLRALYLTRGRPKHYVTLVVPWLEDHSDRVKLYGEQNAFKDGEEGKAEQEEWIRNYARVRAKCPVEASNLSIMFYHAIYIAVFHSIFPVSDICAQIPEEEADVAILEEPEHLNWFRVPSPAQKKANNGEDKKKETEHNKDLTPTNSGDVTELEESPSQEISKLQLSPSKSDEEMELGWAHKFNFVVGIIHTNYGAYVRQYGVGAPIIAAPAMNVISALVVRAYCHKVVKLSACLPSFAPGKEITCNVHGVRAEFLLDDVASRSRESNSAHHKIQDETSNESHAAVYFIGKLMWAKGFDYMLEVQSKYRREAGEFFPVDIYGSGPDAKSIKRAFFGRRASGSAFTTNTNKPGVIEVKSSFDNSTADDADAGGVSSALFSSTFSIRDQSVQLLRELKGKRKKQQQRQQKHDDGIQHEQRGFEIMAEEDDVDGTTRVTEIQEVHATEGTDPLSILGDFTGKSIGTGVATSHAVYNLADSAIKAGLAMVFAQDDKSENDDESSASSFIFDPPKSRFELRLHPIPARFLGVKDHASLKDIPNHKIFLNMSITEVLCTTTAEALAMGKFAIIPKHPSNEFFFQFPNCLTYSDLDECVERLRFALKNEPKPMSPEQRRIFTWEAATERLIKASIVTQRDARDRERAGNDKSDSRIAWLHTESVKKAHLVGTLFGGKPAKQDSDVE